jgi:hypothetical protein
LAPSSPRTVFYHTLDAYTEDNECLVVDTSPENHVTPDEMMRWWRAVDLGPFQMGSKEYWESAQNGGDDVPPPQGVEGAGQMLTPDHFMPQPYASWR